MPPGELPGPCALCGDLRGARRSGRWACAVCGWRVGDAPDPDLPLPRIDVVYYLRYADRIKIGTSSQPRQRPAAIRHDEVLAFERGGRPLEQRRHVEFAHLREGGEWFTATEELAAHIARVGRGVPPWDAYARWMSAELRRRC
ncbi:MAG: GIY-YIG nuclease family protein [Microbacterium sp.]|nr:GIY-YIG nuclease family protein [Microbacterium sp.]